MKKLLLICALASVFFMNLNAEETKESKELLDRIDTTFQKFNQRSTIKDIPSGELDAILKNFEQLVSDLKNAKQKGILKGHIDLLKNSIGKLNSLIDTIKKRKHYEDVSARWTEARKNAKKILDNAKKSGRKVRFGTAFWPSEDPVPEPDYNEPLYNAEESKRNEQKIRKELDQAQKIVTQTIPWNEYQKLVDLINKTRPLLQDLKEAKQQDLLEDVSAKRDSTIDKLGKLLNDMNNKKRKLEEESVPGITFDLDPAYYHH